MAGGSGVSDFGSPINWGIAILTLIVVLFCNHFTKGYAKLASILIGIVVGYVFSVALGRVDFTPIMEASWIQMPTPMHFGIKFVPSAIISISVIYIVNSVEAVGDLSAITPIMEASWIQMPTPMHFGIKFVPSAIISISVIYIVNSVEAVGDLSAITEGGLGRDAKDTEISGGIIASGIASVIGVFFGGLPTATYSQNVGIVAMTKVISKFVVAIAALFMLIAGFIPKFGALITTIPQSVLGGATVIVFAMI